MISAHARACDNPEGNRGVAGGGPPDVCDTWPGRRVAAEDASERVGAAQNALEQ
jgi:hypothetical protein